MNWGRRNDFENVQEQKKAQEKKEKGSSTSRDGASDLTSITSLS
jgi:hypothetical protein